MRVAVDIDLPQPQALFSTTAGYICDVLAVRRDRAHQSVSVRRQLRDFDTFKRHAQFCFRARLQFIKTITREREDDRGQHRETDPRATARRLMNRRTRLLQLAGRDVSIASGRGACILAAR